ncbi:hypothetical protein HOG21_01980 [bacterium]|nr:hypothetical protein [bacterium]
MKKTKKQISTYSKIQKFLSSLLIFSILFSLTFRVSFFDLNNLKVQA